eukprot:gnl/Dysnectes_brevis/7866_a13595_240.p1 GENE.gnl/Dysnectes_brevis/7866_a13595_240~~gnl/Dysnectes_brevis/7866_a13595_240.p1  ORF type:complete len:201 (-),score=44.16 gnl/Dysnectes_brevis/7866_a13595_240:204-806(-)
MSSDQSNPLKHTKDTGDDYNSSSDHTFEEPCSSSDEPSNDEEEETTSKSEFDWNTIPDDVAAKALSLNLEIVPMVADGNCMYRCFSEEVYGTADRHLEARKRVVTFLRSRKKRFSPFIDSSFDRYLRHTARNGVWGSELELLALTDIYLSKGGRVTVLQDRGRANLVLTPQEVVRRGTKVDEVWLAYIHGGHYVRCKRMK